MRYTDSLLQEIDEVSSRAVGLSRRRLSASDISVACAHVRWLVDTMPDKPDLARRWWRRYRVLFARIGVDMPPFPCDRRSVTSAVNGRKGGRPVGSRDKRPRLAKRQPAAMGGGVPAVAPL